jgi:GWxTD domain-containing protein
MAPEVPMRPRAILPAALVLLLAAPVLTAAPDDLPRLFHKAKEQFRMANYTGALETLSEVERASESEEHQGLRASLRPGLSFYRGASLAMLNRDEEAREEFEVFLVFSPNANLDPGAFPKKVIATLEETRRDLKSPREQKKPEAPPEESAIWAAYKGYKTGDSASQPFLSEAWGDGPVRFLLTPEERRSFSQLSDPVSRSEFVTNFWKARDPRPETPENEFREEFEKRAAFADEHFTEDETRGSVTDRGMVFVLLGPPTYVGRKPIRTGEDTSDPTGMVRFTRNDVTAVEKTAGSSTAATNVKIDNMTGPANAMPDANARWREVWHYRKEALPRGLPYHQVDFEFITRAGYGRNVLQRDANCLNAMDAARKGIVVDRSAARAVR